MPEPEDRKRAHRAVTLAVKEGRLPPASNQRCVDCGGRAEDWDHHLGYAPEHVMDVQPRCKPCHNRRHAPERAAVHARGYTGSRFALVGLERQRQRRAWSQQDLADKSGVSRVTISRLETGQEAARPGTAQKLAKALNVKPRELIGETPPRGATP